MQMKQNKDSRIPGYTRVTQKSVPAAGPVAVTKMLNPVIQSSTRSISVGRPQAIKTIIVLAVLGLNPGCHTLW